MSTGVLSPSRLPIRPEMTDRSNPSDGPNPRVSVVMAVRNGADTIEDAIESILRQTISDFELIVIDDASTDATAAIVSNFAQMDRRVIQIRNNSRLERSRSRNTGIRAAHGELVAFMDADDVSAPHRLERQLAAFTDNPSLALVGCWAHEFDSDGTFVGQFVTPTDPAMIRRDILRRNLFLTPAVVARRTALLRVGMFDEELDASEDFDLALRLVQRYPAEIVPDFLIAVRLDWRRQAAVHKHRRWCHIRVRARAYSATQAGPLSYLSLVLPTMLLVMPGAVVVALRRMIRALRRARGGGTISRLPRWLID